MTREEMAVIEKKIGQIWVWTTTGKEKERHELVGFDKLGHTILRYLPEERGPNSPWSYDYWEKDVQYWSLEADVCPKGQKEALDEDKREVIEI